LGVTSDHLHNFLLERDIPLFALSLLDNRYVLPSRAWVFGAFAEAFATMRQQFELQAWEADRADCDDFADLAAWYAHFLRRIDFNLERKRARDLNDPPADGAIAFGTFSYIDEEIGAHMINFAIIHESGRADIVFIEPQTGKQVDLSQGEICSCQEIRV
jgi:hypothetical protein